MLPGQLSRLLTITLMHLAVVACGITAPADNAGFADLDSLGYRDVDQTMTLSLGPSVLKFAAQNIENDPETRDLVANLDGVRVIAYDVVGDARRVSERIGSMSRELQLQGWTPVISVREDGERTVMLMKSNADHIVGLTVITCDQHEAVIVNIMGELRPEMFLETMAALELDMPTEQ